MNRVCRSWPARLGVAIVAVISATSLAPSAAQADGVTPLVFEGLANLPQFPCPAGPTNCEGSFEGTVSGEIGGTHLNRPWTVTLRDATMTADFFYSDGNCVRGTASGTATITAGSGAAFGTYDKGESLPRAITGVQITASFQWSRDGITALVVPIADGDVTVNVADQGWVTVASGATGAGEAAFVPHVDADDQPDCVGLTNRPAITADVAGTVALARLV